MASGIDATTKSPEVTREDVESALLKWRQFAIAEGIAPTKVDQYLLNRADVAREVKALIKRTLEQDSAGVSRMKSADTASKEASMVSAGEKKPPAKTLETDPASQEITEEIGMLDSKSQIEKIKEESLSADDKEALQVGKVEEVDAVSKDSVPEIQTQTAERKEPAATSGFQDTSTGVSTRTSLGMYGYQPSEQVAENAKEISEKGDVKDARTWQATLLRRFLEAWGGFKGLFSS